MKICLAFIGQRLFAVLECVETGQLDHGIASRQSIIRLNHLFDQFLEAALRYPAEFFARLAGVAKQGFDFGRAVIARVDPDDCFADLDPGFIAFNLGDDPDFIATGTAKFQGDS